MSETRDNMELQVDIGKGFKASHLRVGVRAIAECSA